MSENKKKIYSPQDRLEADFIPTALEQANINCLIQGYNHVSLLGGRNPAIELRIMVLEDQSDEAKEIIKEFLKKYKESSLKFEDEDEKDK